MVAPLIPVAIMAASAVASAGIAANASGNASAAGAAASQANINSQERQNFLERQFAERILGIQLSPSEDAFGNRSTFTPGVGFKTTAAPQVKALQDASLREQQLQLAQDAPAQRQGREEIRQRGRQEGGVADALIQQFQRALQNPQEASELFRILLAQGNQGFQGEMDRQQQNALRQDLRSGGGSGGKILAAFAARAAEGRGDRAASAKLQSIEGADQINFNRLGNISGLENLFAQRAQNSVGNAQFQPEQLSSLANALGLSQRSGTLGGSQLAAQLIGRGRTGGNVGQPADFGTAKFVGEAGAALGQFLKNIPQPNPETQTGPDTFGIGFDDRFLGNQLTSPGIRP